MYCVLLVRKHATSHIDSIGLPIQDVSIVFYWLWSHARVQLDSIGLPSLSVSIVFYMHCSSNIKALFPPLLALQFEGLHLTFLVTSQAGPSPRTGRVFRDSTAEASQGTERETERDSEIAHIDCFSRVLHALEACQAAD